MDNEKGVATLLRAAERAHGEYEVTTLGGVRDEAWSLWYARYLLQHGIAERLPGVGMAGEEKLAAMLQSLADAYDQDRPDAPWPDVYAARLVAAFGTAS